MPSSVRSALRCCQHTRRARSVVAVALVGLGLALSDFKVWRLRTPTTARQTDPIWWRKLGPPRAMLFWGFDIGLGFSTVRVASLYWILLLLAFGFTSVTHGIVLMGGYATGLILNLIVGSAVFLRRRHGGVHANLAAS